MKRAKGFSLIELALVLLIVSLLLSFGIRSCLSGITAARIDKTKDQLNTLEALIERDLCKYGKWIDNIDEDIKKINKDGWNREIKVYVYEGLKKSSVCNIQRTEVSVKLYDLNQSNVLVLLLSLGENGKLDSQVPKGELLNSSTKVEIKEDDIAKVITLNKVKVICCKGRKLKIITPYLPKMVSGETYQVNFILTGGERPYSFLIRTDNPQMNSLLESKYEKSSDGYYFICKEVDSKVCTFRLSSDETEDVVKNSPTNSMKLWLKVIDKLGNSEAKEFVISLVKRK